jgi:beta-RFAP synthase
VTEGREAVFVETAARLHFGVLDLRGDQGRWFGGLGTGAPGPTLFVHALHADGIRVTGHDADRATEYARRFAAHHGLEGGVRLHVDRALPRHAGLGSGTQLGLAVARALAELYGLSTDVRELARAVGRARRSAVGAWTFAGGGLVVEGGRRREADACGPLVARLPWPAAWRCVVAVPVPASPPMTGIREETAFASLAPPPPRDVERVAHLVLMALMPALVDADLQAFGRALAAIQEMNGRWFAQVQGGPYAAGITGELVARMTAWGACGVGQSSWGPTVYGVVDGELAGGTLAERVRVLLGADGHVYEGPFRDQGARVWRGHAAIVD